MGASCFHCNKPKSKETTTLYGYEVCKNCIPALGLLQDHTIHKHILSYQKAQKDVPENPSYKEEVDFRLDSMEKEYIKKRMKLLHIQARIREIAKQA